LSANPNAPTLDEVVSDELGRDLRAYLRRLHKQGHGTRSMTRTLNDDLEANRSSLTISRATVVRLCAKWGIR
jgi:hypothetical protein